MIPPRLLTRIALFSALIYVLAWVTSYFPNVNLIFFLVFSAGFLWGRMAGVLTGIIGMGLWTFFNPYGPAMVPIMFAQIIGAAFSGLIGAEFNRLGLHLKPSGKIRLYLGLAALLCTILFYLPVNFVDAWLFQPFWPRFIAGWGWSLLSVISNILIFSLLFNVTISLYDREKK